MQVSSFLTALCIGLILGIIFDFFRVVRTIFHLHTIATNILDLFYWMISLAIAFSLLIMSNWGEFRFYIFIGIILGGGLYYKFISRYMMQVFFRLVHVGNVFVFYTSKAVNTIFIKPLLYLTRISLWPFRKVKKCCNFQKTKDEL